ncbi:MAG: NIL domain-containing protein [Sediminispirochaetaceae bacterium]
MKTKKLLMNFNKELAEKPIVYHLVKDYDLIINIFRAKITADEEGFMVLEVSGTDEHIDQGIDFIRDNGVTVNEAEKGLRWDRETCTHCGNCLTHCPVEALYIVDATTREIGFDSDKCVECLNCIPDCPYNALTSVF